MRSVKSVDSYERGMLTRNLIFSKMVIMGGEMSQRLGILVVTLTT